MKLLDVYHNSSLNPAFTTYGRQAYLLNATAGRRRLPAPGCVLSIGYAPVSSKDQTLETQLEALEGHGCELIFNEKECRQRTSGS